MDFDRRPNGRRSAVISKGHVPEHEQHDQDEHRLDWLSSIRTREQPRGDVTTATKVMVIVDLATRAMWEGSAFSFDPASMRAVKA